MKNSIIITVIVALVVGGGTFFGGMKYQQGKQPSFMRQGGTGAQGTRTGTNSRMGTGFRPVNGEILSADDKSITVKLQDGSSKIVLISDNTSINQASQATKNDLKVGVKVAVVGQQNSDGSVTAQNIQINPITRNLSGQNQNQTQSQ